MTRFDAASPPERAQHRRSASARALIASQPAVFALSIFLGGLAVCMACLLLLAGWQARHQLDRTLDAIQISVFLQPQLSRTDAEGLRGRIEAMPTVAGARLRTREEAMTMLVAGGLQPVSTKSNPLPDVWILNYRQSKATDPSARLSDRIADTRLALSSLPGVESVRVDGRWIDLLDRWSTFGNRWLPSANWAVAALLAVALVGLYFLSGRSYAASLVSLEATSIDGRKQALATVGWLSGLLILVLPLGGAVLSGLAVPAFQSVAQTALDSVGRTGHAILISMGLGVMLLAALATAWGGARR